MKADFSGWASKAGIKCTDGRTILPNAFQHQDKVRLPLVWAHMHDTPDNVLGHVDLEARPEGVYCYGYFNETPQGKNSKLLVQHGDVKSLSIYANQLIEKAQQVMHGMIREVSLVLAGANKGAVIDNVNLAHSDGDVQVLEDEAIIFLDLALEHADMPADTTDTENASDVTDETVAEVFNGMTQQEQDVVAYMLGQALSEQAAAHSDGNSDEQDEDADNDAGEDSDDDAEGDLAHQEGNTEVKKNVFSDAIGSAGDKHVLSHDDVKGIIQDAIKNGGSLKDSVEAYALKHGIDSIDTLFPDAKLISDTPEFISRRMAWVDGVLSGVKKSPFSRIKNILADITQAEARAKGYIKGTMKKEEWFGVTKRTTAPTTVYKKQKLDRDDIVDITDFDVVAWLKAEIRLMLDEEIARAILLGDGRDVDDDDKIKDPAGATDGTGIRSILNEHELYVTHLNVNIADANSDYEEVVEAVMRGMRFYKGSGGPVFYTTQATMTEMLLAKDGNSRRYYFTKADLALALGVSDVIPVEAMEDDAYADILGIIVNLTDYTVGADKGGEVNYFDFFDIDYNQMKYLMETRISGALTKYKSALIIHAQASGDVLVDPITSPTFVESTGVATIPVQTGVVYKNSDTAATLSSGAQTALDAGATLNVIATPASGYYFADDAEDEWSFTRPAA